jgi:hypothetical protein
VKQFLPRERHKTKFLRDIFSRSGAVHFQAFQIRSFRPLGNPVCPPLRLP